VEINIEMDAARSFFRNPSCPAHKQYEALRAYFYEGLSTTEVAKRFGYSVASLYCYASAFMKQLESGKKVESQFFAPLSVGRPRKQAGNEKDQLIIALRKKYLSIEDIKSILDAQQANLSETYIYNLLKREGFARLPRRTRHNKNETLSSAEVVAPKSFGIDRHS
jgi:transposase